MLHIPSLPSNLHSCFCHFHLPSPSLSVFQASFSLPSHVSHHLHSFSFPPYLYTTQPSLFSGLSCALGSFPTPFSLFCFSPRLSLYHCYYFFLPVLSLWLSCYHCSGNKFSWQSLFFLSLHLPHSKSTTCDLLLSAVAIYFPSSSFKFKLSSINCSRALLQTMPFHCQPHTLPHSLPLLLSCYHVCGLSLCAHLMAGV